MGSGASNESAPQTIAITPQRPHNASQTPTPSQYGATPAARRDLFSTPAERAGHGTWQYASAVGVDDWTDLSGEQNERMEEAFLAGALTAQVALGRYLYVADFRSNVMTHSSQSTSAKPIRRQLAEQLSSVEDPSAAARIASSANVHVSALGRSRGVFVRAAASAKAHEGLVYCARFDGLGKTVVTGSRDGTFRLWEVDTGFVRTNFEPVEAVILCCAVSNSKPLVASGADDWKIRLYSTSQATPTLLEAHNHKVYGVEFTSDSKLLISGAMDTSTRLWDVATATNVHSFNAHNASVFAVATSPYSPNLALSGGDDNALISYDLRMRAQTRTYLGHTQTLWACAVNYDERVFCSAGMDGTALLWDARKPEAPLGRVGLHETVEQRPVSIHSVEFSPDGSTVLTAARDSTWRVWDVAGVKSDPNQIPEALCIVEAHGGVVFNASYCPARQQVLSIGNDSTVRLWDTALC